MLFQWSMYYLSFAPLWVSAIFIDVMSLVRGTESPWVERLSITIIPVFFIISTAIMLIKFRPIKIGSDKKNLERAKEEKLITAEFLATFIIPLLAFDFTTWEGMALFLFFFIVFGCLCVRHNYFCTNIMLDVFGYRIYDCKVVDNHDVKSETKIISKRNLSLVTAAGMTIYVKGLNNDYGFDCFKKGDLEEDY